MRIFAIWSLLALVAAGPAAGGAELGMPAPVLPLTSLDGGTLPQARTSGKVTVLNFWATWCPPCRAETSDLITAYAKLHGPGVAFLGIDTTETAPIVKTFISAKGVPYPVALAGPELYNAYAISYIPTTIVLDADGVVRARHVGGVSPARLARYVADAQAGRSSAEVSAQQARIDALLAPEQYRFDGDETARGAAVLAVRRAISQAEAIAQHHGADVDYERTQRAEGTLLVAAGTALRDNATGTPQKIEGLVTIAQGAGDLARWDDAVAADRDALALTPDDPKLISALSRAYYRLHDYPNMIGQARRYTELAPDDGDGWSDLGLAYQRARRFTDAIAPYEKSLTRLAAAAAKSPTPAAIADVADTALDAANVDVALGDRDAAQRTFALANTYADRLEPGGDFAELKRNVKERTQEGLVAVALARGTRKPVVNVMNWTGPDLPGSLASTLKYRLIVAAPADATVTLRAQGLRPQWVAAFCADGLCSPQSVSFKSPAGGVKTYEFQLIPPREGAAPGNIAIAVAGGRTVPVPRAAAQRSR